ncbi:MAG: HupE/UreJ family protein [Bacillota bacterium]|nr:HupE/UreJ family protein [Bacillota bacterium]
MGKSIKRKIISLLVISLLFAPRTSLAHAFSAAFTNLTLTQNRTELTYSIDTLSVIEGIGGDQNNDGKLNNQEFTKIKYRLQEWIEDSVVLEVNGKQQTSKVSNLKIEKKGDKEVATIHFIYPTYAAGSTVKLLDDIFYEGRNFSSYTNLLSIDYEGQISEAALQGKNRDWTMLLAENQQIQQQAGVTLPSPQRPSLSHTSWGSFLVLGMKHILTGYDHLLFIFALLIRKQSIKQYITTVTAFTIAHCITLSLAVLGFIELPSRFVESMIALSICYIAIENIFRNKIKFRWVITFFFGLIHGLGFASLLKEMNLPKPDLAIALLNFNVGIEIIQLIIVLTLVPILFKLQTTNGYKKFINFGSTSIFILGTIWFFQRMLG